MLGFDGKPPSYHINTKAQKTNDQFEKDNEHRTLSSFSVDFESAAHDSQELVSPCCIDSLKINTLSRYNNEPKIGDVMSNIDQVNISEKLPVDVPEVQEFASQDPTMVFTDATGSMKPSPTLDFICNNAPIYPSILLGQEWRK